MHLTQRRPDQFEVWDAFCGAGGTAAGASRVPDVAVTIALNHDKTAISSHAANFPNTWHEQVDITTCSVPRYLELSRPFVLWASPECKWHSYSSGVAHPVLQLSLFQDDIENPAHSQSRMTMNQVVRFAAEAQDWGYRLPYLAVENVPEVVRWHKFKEWEVELKKLGYRLQFCNLNARFLSVPQSRDRLFIVCTHRDYPKPDLQFRPLAECDRCGQVQAKQTWKKLGARAGRYGAQYYYSCPYCLQRLEPPAANAATILDLSNRGGRIGDRKKPLVAKSLTRIKDGVKKWVLGTGDPGFVLEMRGALTARSLNHPLATVACSGQHHQIVQAPSFLLQYYSRTSASSAICEPLPTVTTENRHALVTPPPFLMSYYGNGGVAAIADPVPTVTCVDRHALVTPPQVWDEIDLDAIVQDCHTRMLTIQELRLAQAFPQDYILLGTEKQQKRQIGNAVPPPVAEWVTSRIRAAVG